MGDTEIAIIQIARELHKLNEELKKVRELLENINDMGVIVWNRE